MLLVNPPFYRLLGSHYNANSLGIAYIAAMLKRRGHDAWLYNADFLNRQVYANLKTLFEQFVDYREFFKNEDHPIWEETVGQIHAFEPEWVGYTSYTANVSAIDIISRKLRQRIPAVKQVVGGVHATLDPNVLNYLPALDYAIRREGEEAMAALVEGVNPETISGVVCRTRLGLRSNGDAEVIKQIDQLPFPERDKLWAISQAEKKTVDVSYICSIRGCPYRCNYCASPFHWKRDKTQYRSPESVIAEMKHVRDNYWDVDKAYDYSASANTRSKQELLIRDNTIVYFVDDVFTVKKARVKAILRSIIEEDLRMPWKCEARTDHLDEEICRLMKEAGCVRVKLGFESGSDRILRQIQKDETKEEMRCGARMLRAAGVPFTAYFMAGFPGETDEDLRQTIDFAKEIEADYYSLSILAPYYGTKMYHDLVEQGYELDKKPWEYFFHQTGELMVNKSLSRGVLEEYLALNEMNGEKLGYV
ncbi:MAG: B12-binding domain-containing radical SAM protein [Deltaproteobacteria bacterium]|nr:B12-binding domain-containing radical SAM protein [Deltaproteobacteria bacterium]